MRASTIKPVDVTLLNSLDAPITTNEVQTAFSRLNNNRAFEHDSMQGERLKYAPTELSRLIADMLNEVFEKHLPGTGVLTTPQNTARPAEQLKNNRVADESTKYVRSRHTASDQVNDFLTSTQSKLQQQMWSWTSVACCIDASK